MARIFISYRRDESAGYAGRLHERLASVYGTDSVFMDVDDISPGADFARAIEAQVASCDVVLVLIGNQWLTFKDSNGVRRIDDPADFVRLEIARALAGNVRVIPLLLNNARMPEEKDLPPDIKGLCRRQAIGLSEERWQYDLSRLEEEVLSRHPRKQTSRRKVIAVAGGAVSVALLAMLWRYWDAPQTDVNGRWTAEVEYDFGGVHTEVFTLQQIDDQIRGTASFLSLARGIVEGKVDSDRILFVTRTAETQGDEQREATHQYIGKITGPEIQFVMQTTGGFSAHPAITFTARRDGAAR